MSGKIKAHFQVDPVLKIYETFYKHAESIYVRFVCLFTELIAQQPLCRCGTSNESEFSVQRGNISAEKNKSAEIVLGFFLCKKTYKSNKETAFNILYRATTHKD